MIQVYGISQERLPTVEAIQEQIGEQWTAAWKARHPSLGGSAARISLGGLYLLRRGGAEGILRYTEMGRPFLEGKGIDFSISHTHDAVFCAVDPCGRGVGLDAEDLSRLSENRLEAMARRWFGEIERAHFAKDPSPRTFLSLWTRKEALVKRTGEGMRQLCLVDTFAPCEGRKTAFWTYWRGSTCITLCTEDGECVASDISVLT